MRILITLIILLFTAPAFSEEEEDFQLLMFSLKSCIYCIQFHNDVEPIYKTFKVAERLPLVIIEAGNEPDWFVDAIERGTIQPITGTPTFIIYNTKKDFEMDRLVGYSGLEWFIANLEFWLANYKSYYPTEPDPN